VASWCCAPPGDVAFHHSKTPHMSRANEGPRWRKAVTNHLQAVGAGGEGDPYPWRVRVRQRTEAGPASGGRSGY
jgi:phytanoyl-CoA hydroxylase